MKGHPGQLFRFADIAPSPSDAETLVAVVPRGVSSVSELFAVLAKSLGLPDYFGFNWNALSDCLRDLSWLKQREVILWHEALPMLPEADLLEYMDVLAESARSWRPGEDHELGVVFPKSQEEAVRQVLAKCPSASRT